MQIAGLEVLRLFLEAHFVDLKERGIGSMPGCLPICFDRPIEICSRPAGGDKTFLRRATARRRAFLPFQMGQGPRPQLNKESCKAQASKPKPEHDEARIFLGRAQLGRLA